MTATLNPCLLPTNGVIDEIYRLSQQMQCLDFDIYELVRNVIDALRNQYEYPNSFNELIELDSDYIGVEHLSVEDIRVLNTMLSTLYHRLYHAIRDVGLYSIAGELYHTSFDLYGGDVLVSIDPIHNQPTD